MDKNTRNISTAEFGDDEISLNDLFALLLDEWKPILLITVAVFLAALVYAVTAVPVYRTNALVQVEERRGGIGGLQELSTLLGGETPTEAEIEIIKSRSVLMKAIEQERLDIEVRPMRFPLIGGMLARRYAGDGPAQAWLGMDSYAWGGERIQVDRLSVPRHLREAKLTLTAGRDGAYLLHGPDGDLLLEGRAGEPEEGGGVSLFVAELVAREGTRFELVQRDPVLALEELRSRLAVAERGKQTGILELALEGEDRERIVATLDAITNIYVRQNVERRSQEAAQTLAFLNQQLPELRASVEVAEQALNRFRVSKGSIDLSLETQGLLEQLADVERQISELELERAARMQRFTAEHPAMIALEDQRRELEAVRARLERQIRELPEAEQDALRLMRDVRVANELYTLLLNRAQELKVVQAGTVGNVRIIDSAYLPRLPVKPRKALILALGLVLGAMLGVFTVFLRQVLSTGIHDPKLLEHLFQLPVYAIIPRSETERRLTRSDNGVRLLAVHDPQEGAVESLRSLRTSLEFLIRESGKNIVTIGGPAPGVGKSFVCSNLGVLVAQAGKRVLVVDADMRRGHLHRKFGTSRSPGLSEVIGDGLDGAKAIRPTGIENLHFLPGGSIPPNPAELIVSRRFESLLAEFSAQFDLVLIDAPPLLAASEAVMLAHLAGINLVVVRSGQQHRREVELTVDRLVLGDAAPNGFVFNDLSIGRRRYAYYGGYGYYGENRPT